MPSEHPHKVTELPQILAFDPGVTVGICVLSDTGNVLETRTLPWDQLDLDCGYRLRETYSSVSHVIAEKGPRWGVNHRTEIQSVEEVLGQVFSSNLVWVLPSQWKGTPYAARAKVPSRVSQHEKDVVRMANWFRERMVHV